MGRKIFAAGVAALFLYTTWPLFFPVVMGAILAALAQPAVDQFEKHRVPNHWGAAVLTLAISLLVLVPTAALIFFGAKSAFMELRSFQQTPGGPPTGDWIDALIETPGFHRILVGISRHFPASVSSLSDSAHELVHGVITKLGDWLGQLISALPGLVMALVVTTLSLFFFLVDGRKLVFYFRRNSLFTVAQTEQLFHTLGGMCRSVVLASVVSGLVQTSIMLLATVVLGVPNAALISMAVFVGSFIPVIGSAPVTLGVVAHQFVTAGSTRGGAMLAIAILVATSDNLVRPLFLKGSASLHPLVAFVAAFGGLQTFGFVGIFLGPIIAGLLIAVLQILKEDAPAAGPS